MSDEVVDAVLTRRNRLVSSRSFAHTVRRGRKAGTTTVVLHLEIPHQATELPRVGFVVSKAVGGAVSRNLVKRRLRHVARERLVSLPSSAVLVVRALPAAAEASYDGLCSDFDAALIRLTGRPDPPGEQR